MPQSFDKEAVAPLLRAPAEQGGRVDEGLVRELMAEANRQANETADLLNRAAEALAQNAKGEAVFQYRSILDKTWRDCDEMDADAYGQTGCHEVRKLYLHAERARVPAGYDRAWLTSLAQSLASGAHLLSTDWQQRGYKNAANLEAASAFIRAVLAAAPSQPEDEA